MTGIPDEHHDHDIHGPIIEVWPDGTHSVDESCDCPPGCAGCEEDDWDAADCPGPIPGHGCRYCRSDAELEHWSAVL